MLWKSRFIIFIVIGFFALWSCKQQSTVESETIEGKQSIIESDTISIDFWAFYETFHTDSMYQMEHIQWPLQGLPSNENGPAPEGFSWERESWKVHSLFNDMNGTYKQEFNKMSHLIIEKISGGNGTFVMEKRYAKLGEDWKLIYYAAMRMVQ